MEARKHLRLIGVLMPVLMSACGGGGGSGGTSGTTTPTPTPIPTPTPTPTPTPAPTHLPPNAPAVPSVTVARPGVPIVLTVTGTDPQGSTLTYSWNLGDGTTATGASVTHTYAAEGTYAISVTATNEFGLSTSGNAFPIPVMYASPPHFDLRSMPGQITVGQALVAGWDGMPAKDDNGLTLTYLWTFGDGSTGNLYKSEHVYTTPGTYTVTLTVSNSVSTPTVSQTTVQVVPSVSQPALADNAFAPYCAGAFCGAASASSYSGSGVGIWRYRNGTGSAATIDIEIQGVHAGQTASTIFTNGTPTDSTSVPGWGTLASMSTNVGENLPAPTANPEATAHTSMLEKNLQAAQELIRARGSSVSPSSSSARTIRPLSLNAPPALGTTRSWTHYFETPTTRTVEVAATCALPSGRNAVFWLDSAELLAGTVTRGRIQFLVDGFCGANGAYARQIALTGDVWGPAATATGYVEDSAGALQDLNIVMPNVPTNPGNWAGYFSASDLVATSVNAAVAIVINSYLLTRSATDPAAGSTLVHETKHLINFYQRSIARGASHPVWLEETSAMLSEDLFGSLLGWNRAEARNGGYAMSGGAVAYLAWSDPSGRSYNQGGSFGGFLHRRYGLSVDRDLIDTCHDNGSPLSGYQCVDSLIVQWGGHGFEDEFVRQGTSVFGGLGVSGIPETFGFPAVIKDGVLLDGFSSTSALQQDFFPARPITLLQATMHGYRVDTLGAGQTVFRRQGVSVPAGATLTLVIQ